MSKIKSALEIALERTESITSDKGSIGQFEAKQKGKKLANEFLAGTVQSLEEEMGKASGGELESLRQGIFDILISQITLPVVQDDLTRIEAAGRGLHAIIGGKRFGGIVEQMIKLLGQYLAEAAQYEETVKKQYAPRLRQKEEELSRRMGRTVQLDPFQDPEFAAFYNQSMNALKANYETVTEQVREEAARTFAARG